jgi:3',5'-cyclic AMP phosphodiesterase CpdA
MQTVDHSPLRKNALATYRAGRLQLIEVVSGWDLIPVKVTARVESSRDGGGTYAVDLIDGVWRCTCRVGQRGEPCAHVHSVQLCTTGVPA